MLTIYEVVRVDPLLYLKAGQAINGYRVTARWIKYDEYVEVDVPTLKGNTVDEALMTLYEQRARLDRLGTIEDKPE
jgi:hypothetical protein